MGRVRDCGYRIRSMLIRYYYRVRYKSVTIGKGFMITNSVINYREGNLSISEGFFMNRNGSINCHNSIKIGKCCLIGENVHIYDHNHIFECIDKPVASQGFKNKPVIIGDYCWIGTGVTILAGVTIGNNVIIGANCLIYHDIPSNSIVKNGSSLLVEHRE